MVDADVLFAAAASSSENGASLLILRLAELTLIDAVASVQVISEVERNLAEKLPGVLPAFNFLVARSLRIVPNPSVSNLGDYHGCAHIKDLPILVAAVHTQWQRFIHSVSGSLPSTFVTFSQELPASRLYGLATSSCACVVCYLV